MKQIILGGILLLSSCCWAQNIEADMLSVSKAYAELKDFHFKMHVLVYSNFTDKKPEQVMEAEACRLNKNYYTAIGSQVTLSTEEGDLIINKEVRLLVYSKPKSMAERKPLELDLKLPTPKDMSTPKFESEWLGDENGVRHYRVKSARSEILQSDIYIDLQTWMIKKISYLYGPKIYINNNKVEVDYYSVSLSPSIPKSKLSLSSYLDFKTPSKPKPIGEYAKYSVEYQ